MSKLTGWYPPEIKPVRNGYYERDYGDGGRFSVFKCYWDGIFFSCANVCVRGNHPPISSAQDLKWRGLTKEPK